MRVNPRPFPTLQKENKCENDKDSCTSTCTCMKISLLLHFFRFIFVFLFFSLFRRWWRMRVHWTRDINLAVKTESLQLLNVEFRWNAVETFSLFLLLSPSASVSAWCHFYLSRICFDNAKNSFDSFCSLLFCLSLPTLSDSPWRRSFSEFLFLFFVRMHSALSCLWSLRHSHLSLLRWNDSCSWRNISSVLK